MSQVHSKFVYYRPEDSSYIMAYNYADVVLAIPAVIGLMLISYLVLLMFRIYLIERYIIQGFMQTERNLSKLEMNLQEISHINGN